MPWKVTGARASTLRVVGVCVLLSLPSLLISIALELVPLQNPDDGWRVNYGCWIRLFCMSTINMFGVIMQIAVLIPDLKLRLWSIIMACLAVGFIYTAVLIMLAAVWVFPTPFGIVLGAIPWPILVAVVFTITVGIEQLRSQPNLRVQVVHQFYLVGVQATLVVIYSVYGAVYDRSPERNKLFLMLVLPVIKLMMEHVVVRATKDLEEHQPVIIVFCVGLFNALYMSKCIQSNTSRLVCVLIVALDACQAYSELLRLGKNKSRLRALAQACDRACVFDGDFVGTIVKLSKEPGVLSNRDGRSSIRIHSPIALGIRSQNTIIPSELANEHCQRIEAARLSSSPQSRIGSVRIVPYQTVAGFSSDQPLAVSKDQFSHEISDLDASAAAAAKNEVVYLALKLLFESECQVLVMYVEGIVPMMYSIYLAVMCHLPSAEYYPETRGSSAAHVNTLVLNIAMHALLEALTFALMHFCVKWKYTISPARILAFVIERQAQELSCRLFVWYLFLIQLTLAHYGACVSVYGFCSLRSCAAT